MFKFVKDISKIPSTFFSGHGVYSLLVAFWLLVREVKGVSATIAVTVVYYYCCV